MPTTPTPRTARTRALALASAIATTLLFGGCGQRVERAPDIDPDTAARLGLTPDAQDPTQRDKDAGYYLWKPKPEPEGTKGPTSPSRRKIGGPGT